MTQPDDESLRKAFRAMARHDARRTPEFRALVARGAPRSGWRKVVPVASALSLAACVLIGLRVSANLERSAPSASVAAAPFPASEATPAATAIATTTARAAVDTSALGFLLTLPAASVSSAGPLAPPPQPGIESLLFPAELVMEKQAELRLTPVQIAAIAKLAKEGQAAMLVLHSQLEAEEKRLVAALSAVPVDETKTAQRAAELMAHESRIKAAHLGMLIRIKNALTAEQRARLQASRQPNGYVDAGVP